MQTRTRQRASLKSLSEQDWNAALLDDKENEVSISRRIKRYPSPSSRLRSSNRNKLGECDTNVREVEIPDGVSDLDEKSVEIEEQFTGNGDFSTIKVKSVTQTQKNTFGTRRKKKGNSSTHQLISMEDLLRSKSERESIEPLEDIPTLIADKTINVDDYGNVSLENIESVNELSLEQVRDLVRDMKHDLHKIFKGETKCERHDLFKKGGNEKGSLNMHVAFGVFSEGQEEVITNVLTEMFCARRTKYFDYTMKVLLPETMAMLYAKVVKISYKEADKLIMERC